MKVYRDVENPLFTLIVVKPWPDEPWAAGISVLQSKRDTRTCQPENKVSVRFGNSDVPIDAAWEYAQALLRGIDIARQIEAEGSVVLEGEDDNTVSLPSKANQE